MNRSFRSFLPSFFQVLPFVEWKTTQAHNIQRAGRSKVFFSGESDQVRGILLVVSSTCLFTNNRLVIRVSGNIAVTALQSSK